MTYVVNLTLISESRKKQNLSMKYMAEKLGLRGKSNYFQREKGRVPFKATELRQVSDILGIEPQKILLKSLSKSQHTEEVS
ncbi:helix-turn-helix domain-containing protein [Levilactobacillus wangkuiensis]|uniref:helix-turn-helix domain-containing protein n=1 Tax=Levilactobacillus wangkuiensis TaxID=2799566 RepID=UPI003570BBF7